MNSVMLDYRNPPPLFDVGTLWQTLWARRMLIVVIALGVVFLSGLYVVVTKPSFTAAAAILVDPRDIKTTNIDNVLPGIGADSAAIASQVSVIESRDLLAKVFADLKLETDPEYVGGGGALSGLMGLIKPAKLPSEEVVLQKFLSTVSVEREGLTYVIDVSVKSSDPQKAATIANAIVAHYIASTAAQQTAATNGVTTTLDGKITSLQDAVSIAERAVADFKQQNGIFDDTTGGTLQSQVDQLTTQIIAARDALNQAQTKYDQAVAAGTSAAAFTRLSDISSSPATDKLRDDYNQKAAALASAQATFGPKHPTVITAQAELSKVQGLLAREAGRIAKQLKSDRDGAQVNLQKLQDNLDALRRQSSQANVAQVQLAQLQRKADAARAVLNDFMQRSQETSQMQGLQSSQVHVISQAAPPPDPTWPKPMLLLPVSAVLGLLLGCGTALLIGQNAFGFAPAPKPAPASPDRPRREPAKPARPEPVAKPASARRFADLDIARSELAAGRDTPVTQSVQALLRDVLAALPGHRKPYLLAFSSHGDSELADAAAELAALGLERIGAKVLLLKGDGTAASANDHTFILVPGTHYLAAQADLDILVLASEEQHPAAGFEGITFVLDTGAAETRPRLVAANDAVASILAAS